MINLYDGRISDLLTAADFQQDPEVQAVAYAVLQEKRRIIDNAKRTRTLALIDELPEEILDILAVELRTPFYSEDFSIESKRELIKGTLIYYTYMGTPKAVNTMLSAVFPGSYIEEWQDYGGEPYHFQIVLEMARYRDNANAGEIVRAVKKVQRLSAHLDGLVYQCEIGIVIGTKGRGYTYHSTWCGRHEAGTVPWRDHRGGIGTGNLEIATDGTGHPFNSPLNGTLPWRDTAGGAGRGGIEIGAGAQGWPYLSDASGTAEAGTRPWRNTRGGIAQGSLEAGTEAAAFTYSEPVAGTIPRRAVSARLEGDALRVEAGADTFSYTSMAAGRTEAGTIPRRATLSGRADSAAEIATAGGGYLYNAPPETETAEAGTIPARNTGAGTETGAFYADAEGKGFHYQTKWCKEDSYCKN